MKINKGYRLTVTSWENDLDAPNTITLDGLTKEECSFLFDVVSLCTDEGGCGNIFEPDDSDLNEVFEKVQEVVYTHQKWLINDDKTEWSEHLNTDKEAILELFRNVLYDLHGNSTEGFYTRQTDSITVEYLPEDVILQDVTSEFMK